MTTREVTVAARLPVVRATVRAGSVETAYWRAGQGTTVILLGAYPDQDEQFSAEVVRLAAHCRVIVPEHITTGALACAAGPTHMSFFTWLCDFQEGLGVADAHLIATAEFAESVQRVSLELGDRFASIVVLSHARPDTSAACKPGETDPRVLSYVEISAPWCDVVLRRLRVTPDAGTAAQVRTRLT